MQRCGDGRGRPVVSQRVQKEQENNPTASTCGLLSIISYHGVSFEAGVVVFIGFRLVFVSVFVLDFVFGLDGGSRFRVKVGPSSRFVLFRF